MSDPFAAGKKAAACACVNETCTRDGLVIGVGSGSTIVFAVERLGEIARQRNFKFTCVPTSFQSKALIVQHGLQLSTLEQHPHIDLCIDGADEVDDALNCIKGGGAAMLQEKIVAFNAAQFYVIADDRKNQKALGTAWKDGVPLEVLPLAYVPVMRAVERLGGKPALRMTKATTKAGPVVTDNGNFVVDADFGVIADPAKLNRDLSMIPGLIETGLFVGMAVKAYFGKADGSVAVKQR